ncbi:hypothetical protein Angca_001375, partial [Angiostrongylus cantonensis]
KGNNVVLINDAAQCIHLCRVSRIKEVKNSNGAIREALVLLPSHRRIRRPINVLDPLALEEIEDEEPHSP